MKNLIKQIGQGMTEYIIIVALIAIAAIGIYSFFGDTITDQMGNMTKELSGGAGAAVYTTNAAAEDQKGMDDFTGSN
jgi:Flp pilus assembly pilin Flp